MRDYGLNVGGSIDDKYHIGENRFSIKLFSPCFRKIKELITHEKVKLRVCMFAFCV